MTAVRPTLLAGVALIAAGGLLFPRAVGLVPDLPLGPVVLIAVGLARFPRANGGYRSPDYDTAEDRADIDIEGGVASFTIR